MRRIGFTFLLAALAFAGDGRTPRPSSSDYAVHQETPTATIAAIRVSPGELNKNFPSDFSKKYVVVEVAIYPKDGSRVDVASLDFVLKLADTEAHPDTPYEVAGMWAPRGPHPDSPSGNTHVITTETGVIVQNGTDPATGRKGTSVGTYEGVGVSNNPNSMPPPSAGPRVDVDRIQALLEKWALPEGKITSPVAGYLYFPAKKSKGAMELQYAHENSSANLPLPAPTK